MSVLQDGEEHCDSWIRMLGFGVEGVEDAEAFWRRSRAHSPALAHAWAVSVRWSRQKVL